MKSFPVIIALLSSIISLAQPQKVTNASKDLYNEINRNYPGLSPEAVERLMAAYYMQLDPAASGKKSQNSRNYHFAEQYTPATAYFNATSGAYRNEIRRSIRNVLNNDYESAISKMTTNEQGFWEDLHTLLDEQRMSGVALTQEARTAGDPHLRTLDGLNYDFQTVGEYILCKSDKRNFEVQVRQKAVNAFVSLNSAVALNVHGQRVVFSATEESSSTNVDLKINCEPVQILDKFLVFQNGGAIEKLSDQMYKVYWETGEVVSLRVSNYIDLGLSIPRDLNRTTAGLLGNNNGDPNDDLRTLEGQFLSIDQFGKELITAQVKDLSKAELAAKEQLSHAQIASEVGRSWRVSDSTSLFCYSPGTNTNTFTQHNFPDKYRSIYDLSTTEFENAKRICHEAGVEDENLNACIYDVGFTQQKKFVQSGIFFQMLKDKESVLSTKYPTYIPPTTSSPSNKKTPEVDHLPSQKKNNSFRKNNKRDLKM